MSQTERIAPHFVNEIPEPLKPGLLYVSLEHGTMIHLCSCGCGNEVVLPLSPADWRFTYDGEAVSVWPSVGNWSLPCRSHYVIDRGRVQWADEWSEEEVESGRARDRIRQAARFPTAAAQAVNEITADRAVKANSGHKPRNSFTKWLRSLFG